MIKYLKVCIILSIFMMILKVLHNYILLSPRVSKTHHWLAIAILHPIDTIIWPRIIWQRSKKSIVILIVLIVFINL